VKHLTAVNGTTLLIPAARKESSEICFVDYSHCPEHDLCWLIDVNGSCTSTDNCIIDTN
jgi:hypothetical protein